MAIVSRGGREVGPGVGQAAELQQALGGFSQAAGQYRQMAEQKRATQLQAMQAQADALLGKFGGRAFEVAPDFMRNYAELAGIDPLEAASQLGWTPDQEKSYQDWMSGTALLNAPVIGEGSQGSQGSQGSPPPTPPPTPQKQVSFTSTPTPTPMPTPARPPGEIDSRTGLVRSNSTQGMQVTDVNAAENAIAAIERVRNGLTMRQGAAMPHRLAQAVARQSPEEIALINNMLGGDRFAKAFEAYQENTMQAPSAEDINRLLDEAQQGARWMGTSEQTQTTSEVVPLFRGEDSLMVRGGKLAERLRETVDNPTEIANEVLRELAPDIFGEEYVVRGEDGKVTGVTAENGTVWPIDQFNRALRLDTENFSRNFGQVTGGEAEYLRSAAYAIGSGQMKVDELPSLVRPDGTLTPWALSKWGPDQQENRTVGTNTPTAGGPFGAQTVGDVANNAMSYGGVIGEPNVPAAAAGAGAGVTPDRSGWLQDVLHDNATMTLPRNRPNRRGWLQDMLHKNSTGAVPGGRVEAIGRRLDSVFDRDQERSAQAVQRMQTPAGSRRSVEVIGREYNERAEANLREIRNALGNPPLHDVETVQAYIDYQQRLVEQNPAVFQQAAATALGRAEATEGIVTSEQKRRRENILAGGSGAGEFTPEVLKAYRDRPQLANELLGVQMDDIAARALLANNPVEGGEVLDPLTEKELLDQLQEYTGLLQTAVDGDENDATILTYARAVQGLQIRLGLNEISVYDPNARSVQGIRRVLPWNWGQRGALETQPNPTLLPTGNADVSAGEAFSRSLEQ